MVKEVSRSSKTGRFVETERVSKRSKSRGVSASKTVVDTVATASTAAKLDPRSAKTGTFVRVPFGRREVDAVIVEGRRGRIEVEIKVQGAAPVRTSYAPHEIRAHNGEIRESESGRLRHDANLSKDKSHRSAANSRKPDGRTSV